MYLVVLCLFVLKFHHSTSQFPNHMDLQKVGETIFNNEKYNILKPTTHIISDYFKDFILRRDNVEFPTARVFLDDNGFRHYWTDFDKKTKSLRKTAILSDILQTVEDRGDEERNMNKINISNETDSSSNKKTNSTEINGEFNNNKTLSLRVDAEGNTTEGTKDVSEVKENKIPTNNTPLKADTTDDIRVIKHKKKETKSIELFVSSDDIHLRGGQVATGKDRTVAKTTFFCPYFGVITMSAFID